MSRLRSFLTANIWVLKWEGHISNQNLMILKYIFLQLADPTPQITYFVKIFSCLYNKRVRPTKNEPQQGISYLEIEREGVRERG